MSAAEVYIDVATLVVSWWMCCAAGAWLLGRRLARGRRSVPVMATAIACYSVAVGLGLRLLADWWLGRYLR